MGAAWEEGRTMNLDEAISYALEGRRSTLRRRRRRIPATLPSSLGIPSSGGSGPNAVAAVLFFQEGHSESEE